MKTMILFAILLLCAGLFLNTRLLRLKCMSAVAAVCCLAFIISPFPLWVYVTTAISILSVTAFTALNSRLVRARDDVQWLTISAVFTIAVLGIRCFYCYVHNEGGIYHESQHQAMALDGYDIPDSGILYGADSGAVCRDTTAAGCLTYGISGGTVRLTADVGAPRMAFYVEQDGAYKNLNPVLVVHEDSVVFCNDSLRLILAITSHRDATDYLFTVRERAGAVLVQTSADYGHCIWRSMELKRLLPATVAAAFGSNLDGLQLSRPELDRKCIMSHPTRFIVEDWQRERRVWIEGERYDDAASWELPVENFFIIGSGQHQIRPMKLTEGAQLLFEIPQYSPLPVTDSAVVVKEVAEMLTDTLHKHFILFDALPQTAGSVAQPIIGRRDFKAESIYQPLWLILLLLGFFILATCSLLLTPPVISDLGHRQIRNIPLAELGCWGVLMVMLVVRWTIAWRVSAFPMLENISQAEWDVFVANVPVRNLTIVVTLSAAIAVILLKMVRLRMCIGWIESKFHVGVLALGIAAAEVLMHLIWSSPTTSVLLPVAGFFAINWVLATYHVRHHPLSPNVYGLSWGHLLNALWHIGLFMVADKGYGVIFALFVVVSGLLLLHEWVYVNQLDAYHTHLTWMARIRWKTPLLLSFMTCSVVIIILSLHYMPRIVVNVFDEDTSQNHIMVRSQVLLEDFNTIINKVPATNEDRITRVRQITELAFLTEELKGVSPAKYFEVVPFSKEGALYGAQLSDMALLRLGVAEHRHFTWPVVGLFLLLLILAYLQPCNYQHAGFMSRRTLGLAAILLLIVQWGYIYLSVTGRVPFIGQDCPFLTTHSTVNITYSVGLLALVLLLFQPDTASAQAENDPRNQMMASTFRQGQFALVGLFMLLLIAVVGYTTRANDHVDVYRLTPQGVSDALQEENHRLQAYQDALYAADSLWLQKNQEAFLQGNLSKFMVGYQRYQQSNSPADEVDSEVGTVFTRSLFTLYERQLCVRNSSRDIIYLRLQSDGQHLAYQINTDYFYIPNRHASRAWHGNIRTARDQSLLARRCWVNGRQRLLFPLLQKFFFMKPYADAVQTMLNEVPDMREQDYLVTLDSHLTAALADTLEYYAARAAALQHHPSFSVIVANSEGKIWAMPERKAGEHFRVDPNNNRQLARWQEEIDLSSKRGTERRLYSNLNLTPLQWGPGSSLKPLTFAAVSSQYNRIAWDQLQLYGSGQSSHRKYADRNLPTKRPFTSLSSDEPDQGCIFTVKDYLAHSSNFFNSVVVFHGLFSKDSLDKGIANRIPGELTQDKLIGYFPVFGRGKGPEHFTQWPALDVTDNPIIKDGFLANFGMATQRADNKRNMLDSRLQEQWQRQHQTAMPGTGWITPEPSFIDFPLIADRHNLPYDMQVKALTLGQRKVIDVTPVQLVSMYGNLFSMDRAFSLTLNPDRKPGSRLPLQTDGSEANYLRMLQSPTSLFAGMEACIQEGSARYLKNLVQENGLYWYAKTGTIADTSHENQTSMLAVIITNGDMRHATILQGRLCVNGKPLKLVITYIFNDDSDKALSQLKKDYQKAVMKAIVNSPCFKDFITSQEPL